MAALLDYVERRAGRAVGITADLVRLASENTPPTGAERACQDYVAAFLGRIGLEPDVYSLDGLPGLAEHPLYWPGRDYTNRPNVAARRRGTGGGRSLILSGHIDTVPRGSAHWTHGPFSGHREGNRLYGRGAYDMKAGVAASLFLLEALAETGARLAGDLIFESVVDEEFGGVNGTLAGRVRGYTADAAILTEPTGLRICPAQRGGRLIHITFRAPADIFQLERGKASAIERLTAFLSALSEFRALRRDVAPSNPYYAHTPDPVPVDVTCIHTGPWGVTEPITVPGVCRVELFYQTMPGESREDAEGMFFSWFRELDLKDAQVELPIRFLPGSEIPADAPLIAALGECAPGAPVQGMEAPCDMYVFHQYGIPAVLWGASGANAHLPDEYVDTDSIIRAVKTLARFLCRWCGEDS